MNFLKKISISLLCLAALKANFIYQPSQFFYDMDEIKLTLRYKYDKSFITNGSYFQEISVYYNEENNITSLPYKIDFNKLNREVLIEFNGTKTNMPTSKLIEKFVIYRLYALNRESYTFIKHIEDYIGSPHGTDLTLYTNYTKDGKRLRYKDIFIKDYKAQFKEIWEEAYRENFNIPKDYNLTSEDTKYPRVRAILDQFAITPDGLELYYNQYKYYDDIGGDNFGILIPYERLKPVIGESSVLNEFLTPIKRAVRYYLVDNSLYAKLTVTKINDDRVNISMDINYLTSVNSLENGAFKEGVLFITLPQYTSADKISNIKVKDGKLKIFQKGDTLRKKDYYLNRETQRYIDKKRNFKVDSLILKISTNEWFSIKRISFDLDIKDIKTLKLYTRFDVNTGYEVKSIPQRKGKLDNFGFQNYIHYFILKK